MATLRKKKRASAFDVILIAVLGILALITVYPFYNVLILSFSNIAAQAKHTPYMWFWALDLEGYKTIVGDVYFFLSLGNTLFVTIVGTSINMLLSVAGAYVLSKKRLPGRNFLLTLVVIPMLFSGGMIPTYLVMKDYGLINSIWSMILPWAVSSYYVIIMKNYFRSISPSLEEAAIIDGESYTGVFFKIMTPLSKPIYATVAIMSFIRAWGDLLWPTLVTRDNTWRTLPQALRGLNDSVYTFWGQIFAFSAMITLPILVIFLAFQKQFVQSVAMSGIKG